jgi:8-oxo-dGTP pyrophosphatase MutT (NUDIX family)
MNITFKHIRQAMRLANFDPLMAQARMAPQSRPMRQLKPAQGMPPAKQAGVLVLIYPEVGDGLHIVLTRRQAHLRGHSGQISFPGGRWDDTDTDFVATALRETCEELGLCERTRIDVLGMLSKVYIPPSNHDVHPVVGLMTNKPRLEPNPDEVAEAFSLPLRDLLNPAIKRTMQREFNGKSFDVPYYDVQGHQVWGATAAMLSELEQRLHTVLNLLEN